MIGHEAAAALARSTAMLTAEHDVVGAAASLCRAATQALGAASGGILLLADGGRLEPLAATSHAAEELEMYQAQTGRGPCADTARTGRVVAASGDDVIRDRWPGVGDLVVDSGYRALHASPLRWQERPVGGLNLFWTYPVVLGEEENLLAQTFADLAMLLVVHGRTAGAELPDLGSSVRDAFSGRTVVEQAKGVVSQLQRIPLDEAYQRLVAHAEREGVALTVVAEQVLGGA